MAKSGVNLASKNILVTGAAGGIGSVLVPYLATRDAELYCLDDLSSGSWINVKDQANIHKITGSILDDAVLGELPWNQFTHVIHLAAISSLPACQLDPGLAFAINVQGTAKIANFARSKSKNLELFINASTSAVYESNKESPLTENLEIAPHLVYPQTKKFTEDYFFAMNRDYDFPVISFRFFNVFGPMQDYARKSPPLLNYLVREFLAGNKPMLHSNGEQARDYIAVDDICRGVEVALDMKFKKYENFNLCSGQQFSVNQIVNIVQDALNIQITPNFRSADKLWNAYDDLFIGPFPLHKSAVEAETLKSSIGSSERYSQLSNWVPNSNQKDLIFKTTLLAKNHMLKNT